MKKIPAWLILVILIFAVYWQFFLFGKIPIPADTLVGSYFPWLDYKWGNEVGVAVKNPPISDVFSQFILWKYLGIEYLKQGYWPLWNPYSASGTPLLATYHSSALLPFNLLLLLPKYVGWGIYIFGQTLIAALGMYLLLKFYVRNNFAKIAGALVFSLSGLMTTWVEFGTGVWAAAMLPWIFYGLLSFWGTKKIRSLALVTVSFVCLYLSGHAQLTIYSSILFLVFILAKFLNKKRFFWQAILPVFFFLIGILISLIALLPAYDFSKDSVRADEAYSSTFNYGLNSVLDGVRLFAADFFGNPTTYNHWGSVSYHEQTSFLGTITFALILALFLYKKFPKFWGITFLVTLFLAWDNPITKLIYSQPLPLLTYSSASRIFFITSFSGAILAAVALRNFSDEKQFLKIVKLSSLIIGVILFLALLIVYLTGTPQNFSISFKNSLPPLALLLILLITTFIKQKRNLILICLVALTFLDLGRYFLKYNPFVPQEYIFPQTKTTEFLQSQPGLFRISRAADEKILTPNTWIAYGLTSVEGYDPLSLESYARYFNLVNESKYSDDVSRYIETKRFPSKYLDVLNTKYFLVTKENLEKIATPSTSLVKVFEDKNSIILENLNVKPRAYFVGLITYVQNEEDLAKKLSDPTFDPTSEVITIGQESEVRYSADGQVNEIQYYPNKIFIKTENKNPGFLVLAESSHKDWRASINGIHKDIIEVNGALMGIIVPEGTNIIELNYWPKSFDRGLKLSLLGIFVFASINLFYVFRKKW